MTRFLTTLSAVVLAVTATVMAHAATVGQKETGLAAVYSPALNGHLTASGQRYSGSKLTAAHKDLPFGTKIRVTNSHNHKSVLLRVNDRGPVQAGRILDISPTAAARLGMGRKGLSQVSLEIVEVGDGHTTRQHHS